MFKIFDCFILCTIEYIVKWKKHVFFNNSTRSKIANLQYRLKNSNYKKILIFYRVIESFRDVIYERLCVYECDQCLKSS